MYKVWNAMTLLDMEGFINAVWQDSEMPAVVRTKIDQVGIVSMLDKYKFMVV